MTNFRRYTRAGGQTFELKLSYEEVDLLIHLTEARKLPERYAPVVLQNLVLKGLAVEEDDKTEVTTPGSNVAFLLRLAGL